jgi:pimeloyl-ACP methyl ester carboxylesterase
MEEIKIKGLRIAFQRKGSGEELVLLHGALSDSRVWENQIDELSKDFSVIAWDNPGCGQSSDPPDTFRLKDFADCLALFIEKMKLKQPHILGSSFGSGLALEFYRHYPDIPKTLILVSAYAGWAGSLPPPIVSERLRIGIRQSSLPPGELVAEWIPTLFSKSVPGTVVEKTASIMSEFHPAGMRVMLSAFAEADLRDMLSTITIPALLLHGDQDKRSPLNVAKSLHANIPSSKLVIIPGVGHEINIEAPGEFNNVVRKFILSTVAGC